MDIQYGNSDQLHWLWLVAACAVVVVVAWAAGRRAARRFATANLLPRFLPASHRIGTLLRGGLITAAMAMLVVALVDIRWGKVRREVPQRGIEVMVVLDVSRSMLAEDATPNRLQRAKQQIIDMVDEMAGDRIGLVVFAGDAHRQVPLTSHYADFKQALADVGPYDTYRGGSHLGDAIEAAAEGFLDKTAGHKAIVLFTDGEDQGSEPVEAARRVHQQRGIHVFTVGLGDRERGARIPARSGGRNDFVRHRGQVVWSKLEEDVLRKTAEEAKGAYIPAGTKQVDMAGVYHRYISEIQAREFAMAQIDAYQARFQWLLAPAVILLLVEMMLSAWPRWGGGVRRATRAGMTAALFCLLGSSAAAQPPLAPEVAERVRQANRWLQEGKLEQAAEVYEEMLAQHPGHPRLLYNQAVSRYRQGQVEEAAKLFRQTAAASDPALAAKAHYNLGNTVYRTAVELAEREPAAAIEQLQSAIRHYRRALSLDRDDEEARTNIELAGRLIDQLQQQLEEQREAEQEQPGQQQQDQSAQQDQSDQQSGQDQQAGGDEQQGERQQQQEQTEQQDQSGDGDQPDQQQPSQQDDSQQQPAPGRQQDQSSQESEQQQDAQQQNEQQQGEQQQEDGEPSPPQQSDEQPSAAGSSSADSRSPEDTADRADRSGEPPGADEGAPVDEESPSPPPSGQLRAAGDRAPSGEAAAGGPAPLEPGQVAPMTQQEAQKMLQAIRDREMLRRLHQQQQKQSRRVPVEKDW